MLHETIGHYRVEASIDYYPLNPIEDSDIKFVLFHKRYNLGNCKDYRQEDYNSWNELAEDLHRDYRHVVPVYMYDHSSVTLSTEPFGDPWDSGQVGFACVKDPNDYGDVDSSIEYVLKGYTAYLNGEVYRVDVFDNTSNECLDSCSGFFSLEEALEDGVNSISQWHKKDMEQLNNVYSQLAF